MDDNKERARRQMQIARNTNAKCLCKSYELNRSAETMANIDADVSTCHVCLEFFDSRLSSLESPVTSYELRFREANHTKQSAKRKSSGHLVFTWANTSHKTAAIVWLASDGRPSLGSATARTVKADWREHIPYLSCWKVMWTTVNTSSRLWA